MTGGGAVPGSNGNFGCFDAFVKRPEESARGGQNSHAITAGDTLRATRNLYFIEFEPCFFSLPLLRSIAKDQGMDNFEPGTAENTMPTSFREWCEETLKPAVLS